MTPPRFIVRGMKFYVTVRAVNRSYRLVPKRKVREAIHFALAVKLEEFRNAGKLALHEFEFMSNHYHLLGTDITGCLPDFVQQLNSLIARELNALRGIGGKNFEPGYSLVQIVGDERVAEHAVYTLANPVAAFLVAKSKHWRGVSSLKMKYGVPVEVSKPKFGLWSGKNAHAKRAKSKRSGRARYAGRSKLPQAAELVIDRPDIMPHLSDTQLREFILAELDKRELQIAEERRRQGKQVVGRRRAESVHFLALPGSEEMFARNPNVSGTHREERQALLEVREAFLEAYRVARRAFLAGDRDVEFPYGTWLMRQRWNVCCEPVPD